jgi:hypothetical protein
VPRHPEDARAETGQVFSDLEAILSAAGAALTDFGRTGENARFMIEATAHRGRPRSRSRHSAAESVESVHANIGFPLIGIPCRKADSGVSMGEWACAVVRLGVRQCGHYLRIRV